MSTRGDELQRSGREKKKKKRLLNIIDPECSPADASREAAPPACICILSSVEGTVWGSSLEMRFHVWKNAVFLQGH